MKHTEKSKLSIDISLGITGNLLSKYGILDINHESVLTSVNVKL